MIKHYGFLCQSAWIWKQDTTVKQTLASYVLSLNLISYVKGV